MSSMTPSSKLVGATAVAAPVSVVLFYLLNSIWGIDPPMEVVSAGTAIVGFIIGYFDKERFVTIDQNGTVQSKS